MGTLYGYALMTPTTRPTGLSPLLPEPMRSHLRTHSRVTRRAAIDGFRNWSKDGGSRVVVLLVLFLLVYGGWQIFRWGGTANKQAIGDAAFWPVNAAGVALAWRVARRGDLDARVRRSWWFIGAGLLAYLLGDVLQFVYESVLHAKPYPSFADVAYLAFYPLVLIGILQFPRESTTHSTRARSRLDIGSLVIASAAVVWFVLLAPSALAKGQSALQVVFSIAYPCGDLVLIFGVTLFVVLKSASFRGWPLYVFSASLGLFVVADLIYGRLALDNAYMGGDPIDAVWMVALAMLALSASEYARTAGTKETRQQERLEAEDTALFAYIAVIVSFILMIATVVDEGALALGAIGLTGTAVVGVLARLHWSGTERRRLGLYYQALVERVADYVVVLGADFVPRYVSPALLKLVGLPIDAIVDEQTIPRFVVEEDIPLVLASLERAAAAFGTDARAEIRVRDANGQTRNVVGTTTNLLDDPAVEGLVVVLHDVTENARLEEELRHQALHDVLTGLPNRALIYDRLTQMLAAAKRRGLAVAALYIDLDDFKDVNDSLGHRAGDELLQVVAGRLDSLVRGQDTVGRVGGDEFVLMAEITDEPGMARLLAQRVLDVMLQPIELGSIPGRLLNIGTSIGIAVGTGGDPGELLRNADLALYRAKATGKGGFAEFEPEMYLLAAERLELESDLSTALSSREFFLVYQPVINLATLVPFGVEALLRWQHPSRGVVSPVVFIPLLEERGLIVEVGRWVLNQACDQGARWQREGRALTMNVNASALQLLDANFAEDVREALARSGLEPPRLVVEITESVLMREPAKIAAMLRKLKELGVQIAIDDFGTGYSSLAYLRQFPIDVLKIDQSFVADMQHSKEAATVVRTLVHLGSELGIETVAEGIEESGQLMALHDEKCDFGQGFLFAKPMSPEALATFLDAWRPMAPSEEVDIQTVASSPSSELAR